MEPGIDHDAKRLEVQEQQKPIAAWMRDVIEQKKLTPTRWALDAGLGRATVNRALKEQHEFVTSTRTLLKLAKAAGVPPPLDLGAEPGIPPSAILGAMLLELLRYMTPDRNWPEELSLPMGRALRQALLEISEEVEQHGDQVAYARMAARMAARAQRLEDDTPEAPGND